MILVFISVTRAATLMSASRIGAALLEQNHEWQLMHRYMQVEAMVELLAPAADPDPMQLPPKAA